MPMFKPSPADFETVEIEGTPHRLLRKQALDKFNPDLLGLGDIATESISTDAVAAVFDLEGFTNFCGQIEPHLSVPIFLSRFLSWIMQELRAQTISKSHDRGATLYSPLPFFVKFMGDGLLVLWSASEMADPTRRMVLITAKGICEKYKSAFLNEIAKKVVEPPPILRCGVARGTVYSVGNGNDYVGSCINMAARIQKLPGTTFAVNIRGFVLDETTDKYYEDHFVIKKVKIRGIGNNELIAILRTDVDAMSAVDKAKLKDA